MQGALFAADAADVDGAVLGLIVTNDATLDELAPEVEDRFVENLRARFLKILGMLEKSFVGFSYVESSFITEGV